MENGQPEVDEAHLRAVEREIRPALEALLKRTSKGIGIDGRVRASVLAMADRLLTHELARWEETEEPTAKCQCGLMVGRRRAGQRRKLITVCGPIVIHRSFYYCEQCDREFAPLDECLGLVEGSDCTAALRELISFVQAEETVETTAETLSKLLGFQLSPSTVDRVAGVEGARAVKELDASEGANVDPAPERLLLEIDGCMTPQRDGWHEAKVAVIADASSRVEKPPSKAEIARAKAEGRPPRGRDILLRRSYVADARSLDDFKRLLWSEAESWGVHRAQEIVVLGDAAPWIRNLAEELFMFPASDEWAGEKPAPRLIQIVDWYHAVEHLWTCAEITYGNREQARARKWVHRLETLLWDSGDAIGVAKALERASHRVSSKEAKDGLNREASFFRNNGPRMDYPSFRSSGLPVGSGPVEGACKNVIQTRFKRAGMRWSRSGLAQVLALRLFRLNDRWRRLWPLAA